MEPTTSIPPEWQVVEEIHESSGFNHIVWCNNQYHREKIWTTGADTCMRREGMCDCNDPKLIL